MSILINISNHHSSNWSERQQKGWDEILDIPFPKIDPRATPFGIHGLASKFLCTEIWSAIRLRKNTRLTRENFRRAIRRRGITFHVAGELAFFFSLVNLLKKRGGRDCQCVVASSERRTTETVADDGTATKTAQFEFVRWREVY